MECRVSLAAVEFFKILENRNLYYDLSFSSFNLRPMFKPQKCNKVNGKHRHLKVNTDQEDKVRKI